MIQFIIEFCINIILYSYLAIIGFYTGEIFLFLITLGGKKIRWDYYKDVKSSGKWVILTDASVWLGVFIWMIAIVLII